MGLEDLHDDEIRARLEKGEWVALALRNEAA